MEAVAHSPSFAKKVGVPQSVGQDFAKADKGHKFSKGGDMMNSKMKMFEKSGKDVEKKGMKEGSKADMALDKKQMMGMKKGGMSKKMAGGGLSAGHKSADGIASKGKTKGKDIAMKKGGMVKRMAEGGYTDEMSGVDEAIAKQNSMNDMEDDTSMLREYTPTKTQSKPAPKTTPKSAAKTSNYSNEGRFKPSPKETDETKMSVNDRIKASRSKSREGTTDTRSVNERVRSLFGMAKGGTTGSFRSSANGIAQRGKTRGKMC